MSEIDRCDLIQPELRDALLMVKVLAIAGASRKGTLSVQINTYEAGLDVAVRGEKPSEQGLEISLAQTAKHFPSRGSAGKRILSLCAPHSFKGFGRTNVVPPAGAFLQATKEGENSLLYHVQSIVEETRSVIDLFCGCGTFALPLAETKEVHAVEGEKRWYKQWMPLGARQKD